MKQRALVNHSRKNAFSVALAKHTSTQTCEKDLSPLHRVKNGNTIRDLFYKQTCKKWSNRKDTKATKRLMQTLIVKPRFESTPQRTIRRDENSDTDCEMLIENVTPIRNNCKHFKRHSERSTSQGGITNEMSKSDSNVPSQMDSAGLDQLLFDNTIFESSYLDVVENEHSGKDGPLPLNSAVPGVLDDQRQNISPDTGVYPEESKDHSIVSEVSLEMKSMCASKPDKMFRKPPPLPIITQKAKNSQVPVNRMNVTAVVHCEDLQNINFESWSNDSFATGILNNSKCNRKAVNAANQDKSVSLVKRPIQLGRNQSPVMLKKLKKTIDDSNRARKNISVDKIIDADDIPVMTEKETPNRRPSLSSRISGTIVQNNKTSIEINSNTSGGKSRRECNSNKYGEDLRNESNDKSLSNASNSSELSVGEKVRRRLMTNAQKPVTSKPKTSEVNMSLEMFTKLGTFFDLPSEVKTLFQTHKGINKLYEWQEECLSLQAVHERINLVYALPTSGGKTLVAEILILRELLCRHKNAMFILPYISIVQEKVHSLSQFAIDLGFLVEEYAAGKGQYPPKKRRHRQSVYVATIEKAHSLINSLIEMKRLSEIGLVVVDELHLLGEGDRGATLECLLSKLIFSKEKVHIVGMSATIGNLEEVAKFLHAEIYLNSFRPVELKEYVKCEDTLLILNNTEEELLTTSRKIDPPYSADMKKADPDRVCSLVLEVVPRYSCLVFCCTKSNCENLASLFARLMPRRLLNIKKEERQALVRALSNEGRGSVCEILQKSIPMGIAYHHSGLTGDERRLLEEAYRTGTLCCICCTSTLAAGVNLPAKRVILRAPYVGNRFISVSQYKQMVGRAGRAGFDETGESILICQERDMPRVRELLNSKMDNANSQLHTSQSRGLQSLILSSIGLGIASCRSELHKMVTRTLLHVQSAKHEVNSNQLVDKAIVNLFKLAALKVHSTTSSSKSNNNINGSGTNETDVSLNITRPGEGNNQVSNCNNESKPKVKNINVSRDTILKVSRIGRAAMKGPVDLSRAAELYRDLVKAQTSLVLLSCLHLLYLVTPYEMLDVIKFDSTICFNAFNDMNIKDMQTAHVLGITHASMVRVARGSKASGVQQRVLHRFYITLILNDLWNQDSVWEVSKKFNVPRGTVQTLMTSAATFASCVMHFCEELQEFWAIKDLLTSFVQRLSHCCSAELLELMELPAVKMGRARQLYKAGYKTLKDIANANATTLVTSIDHLPRKVANQIISASKLLLLAKAENLREEAEDVLEGLFSNKLEKQNIADAK